MLRVAAPFRTHGLASGGLSVWIWGLGLGFCLFLGVALCGCSAHSSGQLPEDVAREFVRAVVEDDATAASAAAGFRIDPAELRDFRVAWTGQDEPGVLESVAWQTGQMGDDTRMYGITALEVAEIDIPASRFEDGSHEVVLGLKDGRWTVVMAE